MRRRDITQKNDASCLSNRYGRARRAKRQSAKRLRQKLAKLTIILLLERP